MRTARLPLAGPASDLALHETGGAAIVTQPDGILVDGVQCGEGVDEGERHLLALGVGGGISARQLAAADVSGDLLHTIALDADQLAAVVQYHFREIGRAE